MPICENEAPENATWERRNETEEINISLLEWPGKSWEAVTYHVKKGDSSHLYSKAKHGTSGLLDATRIIDDETRDESVVSVK